MTQTAPTLELVDFIPEPARASAAKGGSVYSQVMRDMSQPKTVGKGRDAKTNYTSFFVQATVADTIEDAAEREKAAKDECKKLANQFTSIARRIKKTLPNANFAQRTMKDANGNWGLRVYRMADTAFAT